MPNVIKTDTQRVGPTQEVANRYLHEKTLITSELHSVTETKLRIVVNFIAFLFLNGELAH